MNMKKVAFEPDAFADFGEWGIEDKRIFLQKLPLYPFPCSLLRVPSFRLVI